MKCKICNNESIYKNYCKIHFCEYFEKKVRSTILKFKLIKKKDKVLVAVSGGKDSLTTLFLLKKFGFNVKALCIDEGILGYRDNTINTLKEFCKTHSISLKIISFKENFNNSLDEILIKKKFRPCSVCGIFRRYLLNQNSRGFDALATGHNLDDEVQAVVMNLIKNNITTLNRQGPISGILNSTKFTKRIKPLYLCLEKEVMIYSYLNNLTTKFNECPNVSKAFRLRVRDSLNQFEMNFPNTKLKIITWFINYKKNIKRGVNSPKKCKVCGENSTNEVCNTCNYVRKIKCL